MRIYRRFLLPCAAVLVGAGACSTSIESCDPNTVDEVFTSAACDAYFQQRIAQLETRIAVIEAEAARQVAAARQASSSSDEIRLEINTFQSRVDDLQASIDRMRLELSGLARSNEEQTRLAAAMRKQVDDATKTLADAKANAGPTEADIRKLEQSIRAQQAAYQALLDIYKSPI